MILNCMAADFNPVVTYKWFRDGAFFASGAVHTFQALPSDHEKTFKCEATNTAGTVGQELDILVERKSGQVYHHYSLIRAPFTIGILLAMLLRQ